MFCINNFSYQIIFLESELKLLVRKYTKTRVKHFYHSKNKIVRFDSLIEIPLKKNKSLCFI